MKSLYWRMVFFLKARKSRKMRKSLGTNIRAIITQSSNGLFAVDPEDLEVGEKLRKGGFGLDEIKRIKSLISDDSRVLIVGSHIGSLVIPISRHCKEVVAIEANPKTYELLSLNLRLNNIENVVSHNIAASEKTEIITFFLTRLTLVVARGFQNNHISCMNTILQKELRYNPCIGYTPLQSRLRPCVDGY